MSLGLLQTSFIVLIFLLLINSGQNATTALFVRIKNKFSIYSVDTLLWEVVQLLPILCCVNVLIFESTRWVLLHVAPFLLL